MDESIRCTACRMWITGGEERRAHYRSDVHRVNLKRKVTGLGPLTETELAGRLQAVQGQREETGKGKQVCSVCSKKFSSRKALENHSKSKRHRDALMKMEMSVVDSESFTGETEEEVVEWENGEVEEMDEEDVDDELERRMERWMGEKEGMFSGIFDTSWHECGKEAFEHARKTHGLFIPYEEFVKDWDGLIRYIGQKVGIGYACVWCDRGFGSADAARRHMKDVGHCGMGEEWVEEYGEFYEWNEADEGEEGWEEVEGVVEGDVEDGDGDEVGLIIGEKVVGHRSYARYYRQGVGRSDDLRVSVRANKKALQELKMVRWKGIDKESVKCEKMRCNRRQRFELVVGGQNYYTRKARFKQKMVVFNTGYRA